MLPWDLQPVSPCASSTTFRTVETDVPTDQLQPGPVPFSFVSVGLEPGVHADRNRNAFLLKRAKRRAPIPSRRDPVDRGRGRSLPERCGPLAVFHREIHGLRTVLERSLGFRESLGNRSATCETRPKHDGMAARAAVLWACLAAVTCAKTVVQPPTVGLDLDLHVERGNEGVRRDGQTKERKDPKEWANGRQLAQKKRIRTFAREEQAGSGPHLVEEPTNATACRTTTNRFRSRRESCRK